MTVPVSDTSRCIVCGDGGVVAITYNRGGQVGVCAKCIDKVRYYDRLCKEGVL